MRLELEINGAPCAIEVDARKRLLDVVREDLRLTGTKEGCGEGECGACTVLLDGQLANACLVAAGQAHGRVVRTVEGCTGNHVAEAVQQALIEHGGAQCGICTPGFVMAATYALEREPTASRARLREVLAGNICRCTGYQRIVDAIVAAAEASR